MELGEREGRIRIRISTNPFLSAPKGNKSEAIHRAPGGAVSAFKFITQVDYQGRGPEDVAEITAVLRPRHEFSNFRADSTPSPRNLELPVWTCVCVYIYTYIYADTAVPMANWWLCYAIYLWGTGGNDLRRGRESWCTYWSGVKAERRSFVGESHPYWSGWDRERKREREGGRKGSVSFKPTLVWIPVHRRGHPSSYLCTSTTRCMYVCVPNN